MVKRGEIYLVHWSPGRGSEQTGIRPALVVQNNLGNQSGPTTIVATISTRRRRQYPFHVEIAPTESGLSYPSVVKCEQIQTVDQTRIGRLLGILGAEKMQEVDTALRWSLGLVK
ncbi:MAG: type II toxin-antitoxin system PemK/MazF family toxin [Chloroflexi bacterium]|nr:type II toxin-antitoxin system PemK/MazF family toxin [Chloroflexota bacterium]